MKTDDKVKIVKKNGKLMYDFSNPLLNSIMEGEDASNMIVLNNDTLLVKKDYKRYVRGEIIIEKNIKDKILEKAGRKSNDSRTIKVKETEAEERKGIKSTVKENLKLDREMDDLVKQAEVLISSSVKRSMITKHIDKMEKKLSEAIEGKYYNLQAYYIDLGFLHYKLHAEYNTNLSLLCEEYFLAALGINKESQNSRIGLIQYYLKKDKGEKALKYIHELKNKEQKNMYLRLI